MTQSDAPNEGREEKTAEQILALYPALTKLLAYISGIEKTAIVLAMEEYTRDQLSKEREEKKHWKEQHKFVTDDLLRHENKLEKERESKKQMAIDLYDDLYKEREKNKRLEEGILKFVHHWRIFFNSPKVGQPPNLSDLESLIAKDSELDKP